MATEGVGDAKSAFRVVPPFTVHNEAVGVAAGGQFDRRGPKTVFVRAHGYRVVLPLGEVTGEEDVGGAGGREVKGVFPGRF